MPILLYFFRPKRHWENSFVSDQIIFQPICLVEEITDLHKLWLSFVNLFDKLENVLTKFWFLSLISGLPLILIATLFSLL